MFGYRWTAKRAEFVAIAKDRAPVASCCFKGPGAGRAPAGPACSAQT
jgi:hypothetical protein